MSLSGIPPQWLGEDRQGNRRRDGQIARGEGGEDDEVKQTGTQGDGLMGATGKNRRSDRERDEESEREREKEGERQTG